MKPLISCLLLISVLALTGGTNIWAETTSSQTDVTITVKASPPVVPTPNQRIPTSKSLISIRGTPLQTTLPRTNDQATPFWEGVIGLFCLLLACLLLKLNLSKKKENEQMMKTTTLAATVILTMLGGTLLSQGTAHADATANTNATISVTSGGLNIDPLASIDFNAITLNGQAQTSTPKTAGLALSLHDYRGSTNGWYLQANYKEGATLGGGMTLKLAPTADQGKAASVSLNGSAQNIDVLDKAEVNKPDTKITLNPTIEVPANTTPNNYTATIDWNVVDGAPS